MVNEIELFYLVLLIVLALIVAKTAQIRICSATQPRSKG